MALFDENGVLNYEEYQTLGLGASFCNIQLLFKRAIDRAVPNFQNLLLKNLFVRFYPDEHRFVVHSKPLDQQDAETKYDLGEAGVEYTYTPPTRTVEAIVTEQLQLRQSFKVYQKDYAAVSSLLRRVFEINDINGRNLGHHGAECSVGDVMTFHTANKGEDNITWTQHDFNPITNSWDGVEGVSSLAVMSDRHYTVTVEVVENPPVAPTNPGIEASHFDIRDSDFNR